MTTQNKPEKCEGMVCPACHSDDTVGLSIDFEKGRGSTLGWCSNGCHWYKSWDEKGEKVEIYYKG